MIKLAQVSSVSRGIWKHLKKIKFLENRKFFGSLKKFSQFGPAISAIYIYINEKLYYIDKFQKDCWHSIIFLVKI